jgi:Calcineurin-like phosphoesterase
MMLTECPTYLPESPRIVVIGDAHGDIGRMATALRALQIINDNMQWIAQPANTIVVQMGDQVDSANRVNEDNEWELMPDTDLVLFMDRLDNMARLQGGRVLSIIGNHEIMNIVGEFMYVSPKSAAMNGGLEARRKQFAPGGYIAEALAKRCVILKVGRLLFCHGGLLPKHLDMMGDNLHIINQVFRKFVKHPSQLSPEEAAMVNALLLSPEGIVWTRTYAEMAVKGEDLCSVVNEVLARTDSTCICVGHNTVNTITQTCNGRLWLTDAMFSRAYGSDRMQVLQITDGTKYQIMAITI